MNPKLIFEYLSNIQQQTNFSLKMHSLQNASSGRNAVVHIQGHCVSLVLYKEREKDEAEHAHQACALYSGEVTPLSVEPMGPMRTKNMNGFQWRERNYFLVPVVICPGLHIRCFGI